MFAASATSSALCSSCGSRNVFTYPPCFFRRVHMHCRVWANRSWAYIHISCRHRRLHHSIPIPEDQHAKWEVSWEESDNEEWEQEEACRTEYEQWEGRAPHDGRGRPRTMAKVTAGTMAKTARQTTARAACGRTARAACGIMARATRGTMARATHGMMPKAGLRTKAKATCGTTARVVRGTMPRVATDAKEASTTEERAQSKRRTVTCHPKEQTSRHVCALGTSCTSDSPCFQVGSGESYVSGACCACYTLGSHVRFGVSHTSGAFSMVAALCPICSACSTSAMQLGKGLPKVKDEEEPKWSPQPTTM